MRWICKLELGENVFAYWLTNNFSVENLSKVEHFVFKYYGTTVKN